MSIALTFFFLLLLPGEVRSKPDDEMLVEKDATFALELLSPLSTEVSHKGDKFECKVLSPAQLAGSIVSGHIRKVKSSGKGKGKSEMDLAFDTITLADGRIGGFNATVLEVNDVAHAGNEGVADNEGTVKGKSRVKIGVKRAVTGALIVAGGCRRRHWCQCWCDEHARHRRAQFGIQNGNTVHRQDRFTITSKHQKFKTMRQHGYFS
jgi:hypothetical protein